MNRQRYVCLIIFFLLPFYYPLFLWPMKFTGWIFWNEPQEIIKHIWNQMMITFSQPNQLRKRDWLYIFIVTTLTYLPYWITAKVIKAVWVVYF